MVMSARDPVAIPKPESAAELVAALCTRAAKARTGLAAVANGESARPDIHVADLVHFLTILHGEVPSLFGRLIKTSPSLQPLLEGANVRLQADRRWLAELSVSTGGATDLTRISEAEIAVREIRETMLTLAGSQREGCSLGVALAFLAEWPELRRLFDEAGTLAFSFRWPSSPPPWPREDLQNVAEATEAVFGDARIARAISFGSIQFSEVHGQILALADERAAAR